MAAAAAAGGGASPLLRSLFVVPVAFAAGLALKEWREAEAKLEEVVDKRVQQRLGEWVPPRLSEEVRARARGAAGLGGSQHRGGCGGGGWLWLCSVVVVDCAARAAATDLPLTAWGRCRSTPLRARRHGGNARAHSPNAHNA
jgi:hypothetical protein